MSQNKKTMHCCELMDYYLNEKKVLIFYNPIFREYFISLRSYKKGKQSIYSCPWCSQKFPPSLIQEYIKILSEEYEIFFDHYLGKYFDISSNDNEFFFYSPAEIKNIPEEFKSDTWWKKREL